MGPTLDFGVVLEHLPDLLWGVVGTFELALGGIVLAMAIGLAGVVLRTSRVRVVRIGVMAFVEAIRNTPFLVQIFFFYFGLPKLGILLSPMATAILALGINGGAYAIEIIRGGVQSIARGQWEAGLALGLHRLLVFRLVIIKPALRAIYPALTGQFILLTLTTSICTSVSAEELTYVAQRIDSDTFRSFEVYFTATLIYLAVSWVVMSAFALIARRYFSYPVR